MGILHQYVGSLLSLYSPGVRAARWSCSRTPGGVGQLSRELNATVGLRTSRVSIFQTVHSRLSSTSVLTTKNQLTCNTQRYVTFVSNNDFLIIYFIPIKVIKYIFFSFNISSFCIHPIMGTFCLQ